MKSSLSQFEVYLTYYRNIYSDNSEIINEILILIILFDTETGSYYIKLIFTRFVNYSYNTGWQSLLFKFVTLNNKSTKVPLTFCLM